MKKVLFLVLLLFSGLVYSQGATPVGPGGAVGPAGPAGVTGATESTDPFNVLTNNQYFSSGKGRIPSIVNDTNREEVEERQDKIATTIEGGAFNTKGVEQIPVPFIPFGRANQQNVGSEVSASTLEDSSAINPPYTRDFLFYPKPLSGLVDLAYDEQSLNFLDAIIRSPLNLQFTSINMVEPAIAQAASDTLNFTTKVQDLAYTGDAIFRRGLAHNTLLNAFILPTYNGCINNHVSKGSSYVGALSLCQGDLFDPLAEAEDEEEPEEEVKIESQPGLLAVYNPNHIFYEEFLNSEQTAEDVKPLYNIISVNDILFNNLIKRANGANGNEENEQAENGTISSKLAKQLKKDFFMLAGDHQILFQNCTNFQTEAAQENIFKCIDDRINRAESREPARFSPLEVTTGQGAVTSITSLLSNLGSLISNGVSAIEQAAAQQNPAGFANAVIEACFENFINEEAIEDPLACKGATVYERTVPQCNIPVEYDGDTNILFCPTDHRVTNVQLLEKLVHLRLKELLEILQKNCDHVFEESDNANSEKTGFDSYLKTKAEVKVIRNLSLPYYVFNENLVSLFNELHRDGGINSCEKLTASHILTKIENKQKVNKKFRWIYSYAKFVAYGQFLQSFIEAEKTLLSLAPDSDNYFVARGIALLYKSLGSNEPLELIYRNFEDLKKFLVALEDAVNKKKNKTKGKV